VTLESEDQTLLPSSVTRLDLFVMASCSYGAARRFELQPFPDRSVLLPNAPSRTDLHPGFLAKHYLVFVSTMGKAFAGAFFDAINE